MNESAVFVSLMCSLLADAFQNLSLISQKQKCQQRICKVVGRVVMSAGTGYENLLLALLVRGNP